MNALWAKAALFFNEAKGKMTTYVALLVASAGELRDQWQQITDSLPHWKWLVLAEHHAFLGLGALMVYARIRRALKNAGPEILPPPVAR